MFFIGFFFFLRFFIVNHLVDNLNLTLNINMIFDKKVDVIYILHIDQDRGSELARIRPSIKNRIRNPLKIIYSQTRKSFECKTQIPKTKIDVFYTVYYVNFSFFMSPFIFIFSLYTFFQSNNSSPRSILFSKFYISWIRIRHKNEGSTIPVSDLSKSLLFT